MKTTLLSEELETNALAALKAVLHQVSTIELKAIVEKKSPDLSRQTEFEVQIGVLGQNHTLTCKVTPSCELRAVRKALREFQEDAARFPGNAIPVFIAPYVSQEARELCITSKTGFVDFDENARLVLGDVFIAKRSLALEAQRAPVMSRADDTASLRKMSSIRVTAPTAEFGVPAINAA